MNVDFYMFQILTLKAFFSRGRCKIYLRKRQSTREWDGETQRERMWERSSIAHLQNTTTVWCGQVEASSQGCHLGFPYGWQEFNYLHHHLLPPRHGSQKLHWNRSVTQVKTTDFYMGCKFFKLQVNSLSHNVCFWKGSWMYTRIATKWQVGIKVISSVFMWVSVKSLQNVLGLVNFSISFRACHFLIGSDFSQSLPKLTEDEFVPKCINDNIQAFVFAPCF